MTKILPILLGATFVAACAARADEAGVNKIIRSLAPSIGQTHPGAAEPAEENSRQRTVIEGATIFVDPAYSLEIEVYFGLNSARLDLAARNDLDELGMALVSEALKPYRYLLAGHTDSRGSEDYNQRLSEERAMAVRDYILKRYAVMPDRLIAVGWGEARPKDPAHPAAAINRRVEITLIVPEKHEPEPISQATDPGSGDTAKSRATEAGETAELPLPRRSDQDGGPKRPAAERSPAGTIEKDGSGNLKITW